MQAHQSAHQRPRTSSSSSRTTRTGRSSSTRRAGSSRHRRRTTRCTSRTRAIDAKPAIPGFDPGLGADLYTTNGTTDDYSYAKTGALSWTPELEEGCDGCGFVFPDDEALVQAEFEKNLPFALDLAKSAPDPANPVSHLGNTVKPFYLETVSIDPEKSGNPLSDFRFDVSYGDPQPVRVLAKRSLGAVSLKYRVNGGAVKTASTSEWAGGERYGSGADVYYHVMEGAVTGTSPGDVRDGLVRGVGERRRVRLVPRTRRSGESAAAFSSWPAEDYTGISPVYKKRPPQYLSYYLDSLAANGIQADVYDVDARGRKAPSVLGVLSHYDAVVWYTGDDVITREPGMAPGTASRLANDELLAVRQYIDEGGKLLYTGKYAGIEYAQGYEYDLEHNQPCNPDSDADGCIALADDFLQYYLGAYTYNEDAGTTANGKLYDVLGVDDPFTGLSWGFGSNSGRATRTTAPRSSRRAGSCPRRPTRSSRAGPRPSTTGRAARSAPHGHALRVLADRGRLVQAADADDRPDGPVEREPLVLDVERHRARLGLRVRRGPHGRPGRLDDAPRSERAHEPVAPVRTTRTWRAAPAGWRGAPPVARPLPDVQRRGRHVHADRLHRRVERGVGQLGRLGPVVDRPLRVRGQAGRGLDLLRDRTGRCRGSGSFVDDTTVSTGETTSFEDGLGGWTVTGAPAGSAPNANDWISTTSDGFPEGAAISTPYSIYFGFGFEGISTPAARNAVMGRAIRVPARLTRFERRRVTVVTLRRSNRTTVSPRDLDRVPGPGESLI